MLRTLAIAATLAALPVAGLAQTAPEARDSKAPVRIRSITLTGNQTCPKSGDPNDIIVCAREGEPYRIPKALRDDKPIPAQNQSWVNRTEVADDIGRRAAGLPDTCSPTGTGGQSGCAMLRAQQYTAEKVEAKREAASIP